LLQEKVGTPEDTLEADEFSERIPTGVLRLVDGESVAPAPQHKPSIAPIEAARRFLEESSDPQLVHRNGIILFANRALASYLGHATADRLEGLHLLDLVDQSDRGRLRGWVAGQGKADRELSPVARLSRRGHTAVARLVTCPVQWDGHAATVVLVHDLTERVQAEALRARLSAVVESSQDAILTTDLRGRVEDWNGGARRLFGHSAAEIVGQSISILFPRDRLPENDRALERVRAGQPFSVPETIRLHKGGQPVVVSVTVSPVNDAAGRPVRAACIYRDITELKRAEDALRRSEFELRSFYDSAPFMMGIAEWLDGDVRVVSANAAFESFVGAHGGALAGKLARDLGPAGRTLADWILRYAARGEGPTPIRFTHPDQLAGKSRVLNVVVAPIAGARSRVCFIAEDVTEQEALKRRLQLSDRMSSFGMVAAGVAHEINNPLAAAMANVDFAMEELTEADGLQASHAIEPLKDAREALGRVARIVRDLKLFSRSDEVTLKAASLRQVIEPALNMAWNEIRHRARLVKDYGDAPLVECNESRLGQAFLNLVINAAQAIPEGAAERNEIRVMTRCDPSGRAVVEIRDTGSGIDPAVLPHIFDPFFTTKPIGVGTGLGLSIVHEIVSSMGGVVTVESTVGRGTTFRLVFPPATRDAEMPSAPSARPRPGRRGRVLLIDDDPSIAVSVQRLLGRDHDIVCVHTGTAALRRLRSGEHFDVVLCDVMMPEMTGVDLHARLVRSHPAVARDMVFITGGGFTPRCRAFLDSIPNQRLDKPFDAAGLRALIADRVR
jgi:PAS domain S-box-containing protein